jgi:hypothetical protein
MGCYAMTVESLRILTVRRDVTLNSPWRHKAYAFCRDQGVLVNTVTIARLEGIRQSSLHVGIR